MTSPLKQQMVGAHVRRLRTDRGLSLRALAAETGFSPSFMSQVENGQVSPSISSMEKIANGGDGARFIAYLEFLVGSGRSRGNHVHARRTETIYVIRGRLRARWVDVASGTREERVLKAGDLVRVPAGCAHVYEALEYSQAIEFSDTPFDPDDVTPFAF